MASHKPKKGAADSARPRRPSPPPPPPPPHRARPPPRPPSPLLKLGQIEPDAAHVNASVDALRRQIEASAAKRFREKWGFDVYADKPTPDSNWQRQSPPRAASSSLSLTKL
eukprot:gb/GEZJ01006022.1/.p3 GENE.gb/GEZJ01006022.1/~~gb/GEZJ01006022.1/.p3  ORF type:complete len:121 (+),score=30.84 gb/GEZJ01006022.1/:33-365(+)